MFPPLDQIYHLYCILKWPIFYNICKLEAGSRGIHFEIENGDAPIVLNFDWIQICLKTCLYDMYVQ